MQLLLDTHVLIWLVTAPDRLSTAATNALTAATAEVYASQVSLWEMAIKRRAGKLDVLDRDALAWFDNYVPASNLRILSISPRHLGAVEQLPDLHRDPFDRLLITQASHEGHRIVTADHRITQYHIPTLW
ncbi:MAG: type II toxin-antitoxin system VapC family toxin [Propioniciclava sp.]